MGLMDVLNGMQNGPHGPRGASSGGGMSPITMAVLGLIAYKAVKSLTAQPNAVPAPQKGNAPTVPANTSGGGIGDLLKGGLGGLLGGGAAGGILSGGLNDLLKQFQQSGQGSAATTWVRNGANKSISAEDLARVLTPDQIQTLTAHSGLSRDGLLAALSQHLPALVNELTPNGRVPNAQEASQLVQ